MLENTITPEVNKAMEKLAKNNLVFTQDKDGRADLKFADDLCVMATENPDPVNILKANLYLSGNIKFYYTVLGKNGFSGV